MRLNNFLANYSQVLDLPSTKNPDHKTKAEAGHHAKPAGKSGLLVPGIIVLVIVLIAVVWVSGSHIYGQSSSSKAPNRAVITSPTARATTTAPPKESVQDFLAGLSSYGSVSQFTANYIGTISSTASAQSLTLTGTLRSQYQRYNGSAVAITTEKANQSYSFNSTTRYYFSSNSVSYSCIANSTSPYTCEPTAIPLNISTFGLSTFLGLLGGNFSSTPITVSNSSYDGMPCLAATVMLRNSFNNSGAIVNSSDLISGCIQPTYKIPLLLNISAVDTESGTYRNGTVNTIIPAQSVSFSVMMHLANLTNSSSEAAVENLPANAVIVG
jgi:hypothetical protein